MLVIQQQEPTVIPEEFKNLRQRINTTTTFCYLMSLTCTFISVPLIWVYNFGRTGCSTFSTDCPSAACFYFCYSWYLACRRCFVQAQWMEGHKYRTHTRQVATVCTMGWFFFLKKHFLFFYVYFLSSLTTFIQIHTLKLLKLLKYMLKMRILWCSYRIAILHHKWCYPIAYKAKQCCSMQCMWGSHNIQFDRKMLLNHV